MGRYHGWDGILVMPDDLIAFAWSEPMRDLADKVGMSDVGLKKLLLSYGVEPPPQGYWNKVHAGKPVPRRPNAPARRPGGSGRFYLDLRFAKALSPAQPMASSGPFASEFVPQDLEELRAQELGALGRAGVPKSLDRPHPGLSDLLKKERRRHERSAGREWNWNPPKLSGPLAQRSLRLLNGIFHALARRGHHGSASENRGEIHARVIVGSTHLSLGLEAPAKWRPHSGTTSDLPASTPLILRVDPGANRKGAESWRDDDDGKLESKIADITAGIIVSGEAKFRHGLKEQEERLKRERLEQEQRRQAMLAEMNKRRVADLLKSGDLLRQAQDIRTVVERVRGAMVESGEVDAATMKAWEQWALAEADKLDPLLSGQFLTHLHTPSIDDALPD